MLKKSKRITCIFMAASICGSILAGCAKSKEPSSDGGETTAGIPSGVITDKPITLTYYCDLHANAAASVTDLNQTELYKELEKKTKVTIKFRHPPVGQAKEQFNLMIASRDLPDVIESGWLNYPGGPEKAISDNIIIKLNDLIDKNAPNYKKILKENPNIDKMVKTDSGTHYVFPGLNMAKTNVFGGVMVRKDWLDELGLQIPETIDEWEKVLKEFKTKKGAKTPLSFKLFDINNLYSFMGAYNVSKGFYMDNGKVKFGPVEPGFKDFLTTFNRWIKEGLLDPEYPTLTDKTLDAKVTNGQVGATLGYIGGTFGKYLTAMKEKDPKFALIAAPQPVLKKGDTPKFIKKNVEYSSLAGNAAITTVNKYPAETARWLDYAFSEEGHMLYNFGKEDLTYKMENGYPKYTDLIMKNPDKLPMGQAMGKYFRANYPTFGYNDDRYFDQYYSLPVQQEAAKLYAKHSSNANKVQLPPVTPTVQEAEELSTIMSEVTTYVDEMYLKFLLGAEPLENYDKFVAQVRKMGIDKAIKINQDALDRYNKR